MKKQMFLIGVCATVLLAAPALAQHSGHGGATGGAAAEKTEATGVGVINSVDADKAMVNLTHEPMPELGWPTMTMDLPVTKRVNLSEIKSGDKVSFKVKLGVDKQYRVTEIEAAK
jgi:Cu/Ag efflux protein CusF